jgi:hypothetical protein
MWELGKMLDALPIGDTILMQLIHADAKRFGDGQWFYCNGRIGNSTYPGGFVAVPESIGPLICRMKNNYSQLYSALGEEQHGTKQGSRKAARGKSTGRVLSYSAIPKCRRLRVAGLG